MRPPECPRYAKCSANLCPLDGDWRERSSESGPVCGYLAESVKATAAEVVPPDILPACRVMVGDDALPAKVRNQLERSKGCPSRTLDRRVRLGIGRTPGRMAHVQGVSSAG